MTLSIVILTLNSEHNILKCLDAIQPSCPNCDYEIIIVDNGSKDLTIELIETNSTPCKLIKNKHNLGVAKARNIGIKQAKGEYVLILDDDVVMHPNSLAQLLTIISSNEKIGIIAPQLVNPDGTIQFNGLPTPSFYVKTRRIINKLLQLDVTNPYLISIESKELYEPDYLIGAVQLIRKTLFQSVGLLDENIFYGPEDADFCLRVRHSRHKVVCAPSINMTHNYQRRSYQIKQLPLLLKHLQSLIYFWIKHSNFKRNTAHLNN